MAIELSNLTFTEQDDIVPVSGADQITNTGIANTLAGRDIITGTAIGGSATIGRYNIVYGIYNSHKLNTNDGDDIIMGIFSDPEGNSKDFETYFCLSNDQGIIDTGDGNDKIIGIDNTALSTNRVTSSSTGFSSYLGTVNTGNGHDIIMGTGQSYGIVNWEATINTGNGNDTITGTGNNVVGIFNLRDALNTTTFNTGDGNDRIIGNGFYAGIDNYGLMDTGEGDDIINGTNSIIGTGDFISGGIINSVDVHTIITGNGNDTIIGTGSTGIYNMGVINTGNGDDVIIGTGSTGIYNGNVINTGNGDDSIIANGGVNGTGEGYGIYNNGGAINMGDGNDSIIASEGFQSGSNSSGAWFLGEGDDYIKGFGSGDFYGGNGFDTLELTPGTYTVGIWGEGSDTSAIFTKGNQLMITSEFEKLKAGSTIYDFTSLIAGQIIVVA
jgi:hypothetical protein